ncbi:MAG: nonstructural protein [Microviridae sp.]|nr:MAG: nonstructural protein [Microviridae sp.]
MILQICAVFDSATQMYGRPFFVVATGQAIRSFRDEINRADPNNDLHKHPTDFALFHIGAFDDSSGEITVPDKPDMLFRGKDVQALE